MYANKSIRSRQPSRTQRLLQKLRLGGPSQQTSLAAFPLSLALTGRSAAAAQPLLGLALEEGAIDERMAVTLYLAIQARLGDRSTLAPWLALMPRQFNTPLFWNDDDLDWLRGTTLYRATLYVDKLPIRVGVSL